MRIMLKFLLTAGEVNKRAKVWYGLSQPTKKGDVMKRYLLLTTAFFALLITGACSDDDGPSVATPASGGGTSSNPWIIDVGPTYASPSALGVGTWQYYRFLTTATTTYTGTLNGNSDLLMRLREPDGTLVDDCDDTVTGIERCSTADIGVTLFSGNLFRLNIFNFGPNSTTYTINVLAD